MNESFEASNQASSEWGLVAAPGTDLVSGMAGTVPLDAIRQAADDVCQAMAIHAQWVRDCEVAFVERLAASQPRSAAAREPRLDDRIWRRGAHRGVLKHHPPLDHLDLQIARAQRMARQLLSEKHESAALVARHRTFTQLIVRIDDGLRNLLGHIWNLLANIDPLTGLGNRPAMRRRLRVEGDRHHRYRQPCCIAVIDLDRFKEVNDRHGHVIGDTVLRSVATVLAASVRPYDEVFRYGGDEFVLCLPNTDCRAAWAIVERLRLKVGGWHIPLGNAGSITTSISVGVAPLTVESGGDAALERADSALFVAKRNGRNGIFVACQ
jgi:diguanylate cyclase (GGDEF)-like protein